MSLDQRRVRAHFDRAAANYAQAAVLQDRIQDQLLNRFNELVAERKLDLHQATIIDAGCGPGRGAVALQHQFPSTRIVALDFAPHMLAQLRPKLSEKTGWLARTKSWLGQSHTRLQPELLMADVRKLPFSDQSVDAIFSSLCIQWVEDLPALFREWQRVLKVGGVLMLSSFGPDTLIELRQAWAAVDEDPHVNRFLDMHDVGDAILRAGFSNPVLDREMMYLSYREVTSLLRELKAIGANNTDSGQRGGLGGRKKLQAMISHYPRSQADPQYFDASYEVVFAQAVKLAKPVSGDAEISIPISAIRRRS